MSKRKDLGQFYTPTDLAHDFVSTASPIRLPWFQPDSIADIACGDGALLAAAAARHEALGFSPEDSQRLLSGCDIDPDAVAEARRRLPHAHIEVADGLTWAPRHAPSLVVINPPYSVAYSEAIRKAWGLKGKADLAVAFLLRAAQLAPRVSIIATNTLAQGDSRRCGLARLVSEGWEIYSAKRSFEWPSDAAVTVCEAHLRRTSRV